MLASTFTSFYQRAVQGLESLTDTELVAESGILTLGPLPIDFSSNNEVNNTGWLPLSFKISEISVLHSLQI